MIVGGIVLYYSLLWYQSIDEFLISFNEAKSHPFYSIAFYYDEHLRYVNFLLDTKLYMSAILLSVSGLFIKIISWKSNNKLEQFFIISAIASLLYLFFLPIKWNYYFTVAIPIFVIFIPYTLKYFSITFSKILIVIFSFILILFLGKNVTRNEMFLETFHIPSQDVVVLQKLKKQTQNAKILSIIKMYPYLKGDGRELFFTNRYIDKVDYVIEFSERSDIAYLKAKGFEYQYSFQFQKIYKMDLFYKYNKE
jgi:hypothetical protein